MQSTRKKFFSDSLGKTPYRKSTDQHPSRSKKYTILVVEDDGTSQKLAKMLLEKEGYSVHVAESGVEALTQIEQIQVDLILMDITLPHMDGLEAAAQIRDGEYGTDVYTPIIALSANAMKIDREKGFEVGMDAYITKPFQIHEMLETITLILEQQRIKPRAQNIKKTSTSATAISSTLSASSLSTSKSISSDNQPPIAPKRPKSTQIHDDIRNDDYHWLREKENPEVIAYLEAENTYTETSTSHTNKLQDKLYREMRTRIQEADLSVPVKVDSFYYYNRTEEGKQYPIRCRRHGSMQAEEEIILDENELAANYDYFQLGDISISPSHQFMAYLIDRNGSESYTLHVKDLQNGNVLADEIGGLSYGLEWGNDNQTLFYVGHDETVRPDRLFRHKLGEDPANDVLIHHEKDEAFFLGLSKTKSESYLILSLGSNVTSEVWFISADAPEKEPQLFSARQQGVDYSVEHHTEHFIVITNEQAINFRVLLAPVDDPKKERWVELIPHNENVKIDTIEPFHNYFVIYEREAGLRQLRIRHIETGDEHRVQFPDPVYTFYGGQNPNFDSEVLRFSYTSLSMPQTVYDYHMKARSWDLLKQQPVLGGFDASMYESERLFARAPDGKQIPISLIRRKDSAKDEPRPLLLYGYGSYGVSIDPTFNSNRLSLLDRGVTFAIAHVRGSGTMGRQWYEDGKLLNKRNTFTDFIACAEQLIALRYTKPEKLVASGRSAGGLLMGAITNMRPDLFAGIVAGVPFVDAINTMLDASIPLTVIEYEEWGNPNDPIFYEYIKSYSPYDGVEAKAYPHILATAGLNDPRVQYWEPAKWVAKLRALKTNDNYLLLKTNMGSGHGGASGRFDYLEEVAFEFAFILDVLGLLKKA